MLTLRVTFHCNFEALSMLQALIMMSRSPDPSDADIGNTHDEDSSVFFLELLIKVILQNRQVFDRLKSSSLTRCNNYLLLPM